MLAVAVAVMAVGNIACASWVVAVLRVEAPDSPVIALASLVAVANIGAGFACTLAWAWSR